MTAVFEAIGDLFARGGWVMWPLAVLSVTALTLIFERAWFWLSTNHPVRSQRLTRLNRCLREGDVTAAKSLVTTDESVYAELTRRLLDDGASDAVATEALEALRPRIDRFMPTLGTIITAAPMLGILGTVTGIIGAFEELSRTTQPDLDAVGGAIAQALLTTVVGLAIAIVVLFPFMSFKAQIDRTLGRMETIIASAQSTGDAQPEKV